MKNIVRILFWIILILGAIIGTSFALKTHDQRECTGINITIQRQPGSSDQLFMTEVDVRGWLRERGDTVIGNKISEISIPDLENWLHSLPPVDSAEAFITVGNEVNFKLTQRRPIGRIITQRNESYYIDDRGRLMPWMPEYTALVVPVTGKITETYGGFYKRNLTISADSALKTANLLDDIWQLCRVIDNDTLIRSQVAQIYVTDDRNFELIPRIGNHRILLGSITDLNEKFAKLKVFYHEGLNHTGKWNMYSSINLQYKNQIVCTKKLSPDGI
jgi:cell division protein FtsQ